MSRKWKNPVKFEFIFHPNIWLKILGFQLFLSKLFCKQFSPLVFALNHYVIIELTDTWQSRRKAGIIRLGNDEEVQILHYFYSFKIVHCYSAFLDIAKLWVFLRGGHDWCNVLAHFVKKDHTFLFTVHLIRSFNQVFMKRNYFLHSTRD